MLYQLLTVHCDNICLDYDLTRTISDRLLLLKIDSELKMTILIKRSKQVKIPVTHAFKVPVPQRFHFSEIFKTTKYEMGIISFFIR